jgi:DNA-binding response OmpR family regulator
MRRSCARWWGPGQEQSIEYLRVAARGLRRKLEDVPVEHSMIRNEPGIGYRLMVESGPVNRAPLFMRW